MSAVKQLLFASGLGQGTLFLESATFSPTATAASQFGSLTLANLTLSLLNNGQLTVTRRTISENTGDVTTTLKAYDWLTGGAASIYAVRVSKITASGFNLGSSLIDSWLPMDTNRSWFLESTSSAFSPLDFRDVTFVIELALLSNTTNILQTTQMSFATGAFSGTPPIFF